MIPAEHHHETLALAVTSVVVRLRTGSAWSPAEASLPEPLRRPGATFVTLRRDGALLGCIGTLAPRDPLGVDVARNAAAAAFDDPRLPAVVEADLSAMHVHVSVLGPLEPLAVRGWDELLAAVRPGVDGLLVEASWQRATLLPSVWSDRAEPVAFVSALWLKAGLRPGAWPPGLRLHRYLAGEVSGPAAPHLDRAGRLDLA